MKIHPTAIVESGAELGVDVEVGPYTIVGPQVVIGARTVIGPHVHITGRTSIGEDCVIRTGAAIGEPPQDYKYHGEASYISIGDRTTVREYVTIHLAVGEGNRTEVGHDNMIMAYCHIGHNCVVGNHVCMANYVGLSGGCRVEDRVVLGGMAGLHQFVHVGRMAMIGGHAKVTHDIPPFVIADGPSGALYGLNNVGLRRSGMSAELRAAMKRAFRLLFHDHRSLVETVAVARMELPALPEIEEFLDFVERSGRCGRHLDPKHARPVATV